MTHFHGSVAGTHVHGDGSIIVGTVVSASLVKTDGADTLVSIALPLVDISASLAKTDGSDSLVAIVQTVIPTETTSHYHGTSPIVGAHVHWDGSRDSLTASVDVTFDRTEGADTLVSTAWHGVLGIDVPGNVTGASGAALLFNEVQAYGLENKYVWLDILSVSAGELTVYENSSFIYTGPAGTHTITYDFWVNGELMVGDGVAQIVVNDPTMTGATAVASVGTILATSTSLHGSALLTGVTAAATAGIIRLSGSWTRIYPTSGVWTRQ